MLDILISIRDALFSVVMAWIGVDASAPTEDAAAAPTAGAPILQIDATPADDEIVAYRS